MKNNLGSVILFPLLFLAISSLTACGSSDDELILRNHLEQMRDTISQHQPKKFMAFINANYKSPLHRDKKTLQRFVEYHLKNNPVVYIYIADIDVEINEETATIVFYSGITGGPDQIPERGQLYKVGMHWLKTDGQWQLRQAKWRPALILRGK